MARAVAGRSARSAVLCLLSDHLMVLGCSVTVYGPRRPLIIFIGNSRSAGRLRLRPFACVLGRRSDMRECGGGFRPEDYCVLCCRVSSLADRHGASEMTAMHNKVCVSFCMCPSACVWLVSAVIPPAAIRNILFVSEARAHSPQRARPAVPCWHRARRAPARCRRTSCRYTARERKMSGDTLRACPFSWRSAMVKTPRTPTNRAE